MEVKGWHTECVFPSYVKIIRPQLSPLAIQEVQKRLGKIPYKRVLVIPRLSKIKKTRQKTISLLRRQGVNKIFEFGTILEDMLNVIDEHKDYDSEILQTLRLLKIYKPKI